MGSLLDRCLEDLEARIDPDVEERLQREWRDFADGRYPHAVFSPRRQRAAPPGIAWPALRINAALDDPDAMLLREFATCSDLLANADGRLLHVRANYGTSILPSLFGVRPFVMPDEQDTLPTSWPLDGTQAIRRVVDQGVPGLRTGYGARVLEIGERLAAIAACYPRIGRCVWVYHPDLQGPLDVCELLWGSSLFTALYDEPDLVHRLLEVVADTYVAFLREWAQLIPFRPHGSVHWGWYHRGSLMLREDSATNLSAATYRAFAAPVDQRLLDAFGGGAIHFCGKGDHFVGEAASLRGVSAVNVSQPALNDMERVFAGTVDRGINLLGLAQPAAEAALARGRDLHGRVHVG